METIPRITNEAITVWGALQKPGELAGLLDVLTASDAAPATIVEIGSDAGGTLFVWRELWPQSRRFSVSLPAGAYGTGRPCNAHGAVVLERDSHEAETMLALIALLEGRDVDLLFIDGDHTERGCATDVSVYGELVRVGGVLILHDICHHANPDVGVENVWRDLGPEWLKVAEIVAPPETWGGIGVAVRT